MSLPMPRHPDLQLHAIWRRRITRQSDSGLTIAQFSAQERLARSLRLGIGPAIDASNDAVTDTDLVIDDDLTAGRS
jgi:hypothetical protein